MALKDLFMLDGKTALVTGSAHGLGKKIALGFAEFGVSLVLADIDCPWETAQQINALGAHSIAVETDISDEIQVKALAEKAASEIGKVDILVNNAGISQLSYAPTEQLPMEEWDRIMGINLRGTFLCCKHFGRLMIKNGGGNLVKSIPLKRFGKTSDLIGAVLLLSSNASDFITGSVLTVDGGYLSQ